MSAWRFLICGGRDYQDAAAVARYLDHFLIAEICEGGAPGADRLAGEYADALGIPHVVMPADWEQYGKAAGPIRNQQMLDEFKPDAVIAFPGGRGTADMVRRARAAGVTVREVSS